MAVDVYTKGEYEAPEVRQSKGATVYKSVGSGTFSDLYSGTYKAQKEQERIVVYKGEGSNWNEVAAYNVNPLAEHIGFAMDNSGHDSICYQVGGEIFALQFDTIDDQYKTRGGFTGREPLMVNDAVLHQGVGNADIKMYYMRDDGLQLLCRQQQDIYGVEIEVYSFPTVRHLDAIAVNGLTKYLYFSDENGEPAEVLVSDPYPLSAVDTVDLDFSLLAIYTPTSFISEEEDALDLAFGMSGVYIPNTTVATREDPIDLDFSLGGAYEPTTYKEGGLEDLIDLAFDMEGEYTASSARTDLEDLIDLAFGMAGVYRSVV